MREEFYPLEEHPNCTHRMIQAWKFSDDSPAAFWSCSECGQRFEPSVYVKKVVDQKVAASEARCAALAGLLRDIRQIMLVEHGLRPGYGWGEQVARIDAALKEG